MAQAKIDAMNAVTGHLLDSARGYDILIEMPQLSEDRMRFESYAKYRHDTAKTIQNVVQNNWGQAIVTQGKGKGLSAYLSMLGDDLEKATRSDLIEFAIKGDGQMVAHMESVLENGDLGAPTVENGRPANGWGNSHDYIRAVMTVLANQTEAMKMLLQGDETVAKPDLAVTPQEEDMAPPAQEPTISAVRETRLEELARKDPDDPPTIAKSTPPILATKNADIVLEGDDRPVEEDGGNSSHEDESQEDKRKDSAVSNTADNVAADYVTAVMPQNSPAPDAPSSHSDSAGDEIDPQSAVFETALDEKKTKEQPRKLRVLMMKKPGAA